jgi:hypothetical protein
MNAQEIFDTVKNHLLKQNAKSVNEEMDICAYRSPDGLKCAIGCLISDKEYSPTMEGLGVEDLSLDFPVLEERFIDHSDLLDSLQKVHDRYTTREWPEQLRNVAKNHNLRYE